MSDRPRAPHVQAALARTAQAKPGPRPPAQRPAVPVVPPPVRPPAPPQVQRPIQAKPAAPPAGARPMAPHVQAALAGGAQARMAQPGVVQPAGEDIYKKNYKKRPPVTPRLARKAKTEHKTVRSGKPSQRAQRLAGIVAGPSDPGYAPGHDNAVGIRNAVWDGRRASLYWFDNVKAAMAPSKVACAIQKASCTGGADSIDHVNDFADLQTGLNRYVICDGQHHFSAVYKEDALELFNGGNGKTTAVLNVDLSNLQWSCTSCNSSKNGTKGVYENIPKWISACPGGCGYSFKGEQSGD